MIRSIKLYSLVNKFDFFRINFIDTNTTIFIGITNNIDHIISLNNPSLYGYNDEFDLYIGTFHIREINGTFVCNGDRNAYSVSETIFKMTQILIRYIYKDWNRYSSSFKEYYSCIPYLMQACVVDMYCSEKSKIRFAKSIFDRMLSIFTTSTFNQMNEISDEKRIKEILGYIRAGKYDFRDIINHCF